MDKKVQNIMRRLKLFKKKAKYSNGIEVYFQIDALASCLFHLGYMSLEEYNSLFKKINESWRYFVKVLDRLENAKIKDIVDHNHIFLKMYWDFYKQYETQDIHYTDYIINDKNMNQAIEEFFSILNCRELYDELQITGRIIRFDSSDAESWCVNENGNSYVLLHNHPINSSKYYTCLIHEMGHAYVNHILKEKANYCEYKIFIEIIPFLFERLFHQFLYENNFISKDEYERIVLNFEANCRSQLKLGIMSSQIIESGKYTLTGLKVIPEIDWNKDKQLESILKNIDIDCTPWLSLKWVYYILGNIASRKLFSEFQKDKTVFVSNLPQLVKTLSTLNLDEILEKFC